MKKDKIVKKMKAVEINGPKTVSGLLSEMQETGFQGRRLAEVCGVFEKMLRDSDVTVLFGYSGSLSVAGQWKIVNWLIENRYIDIIVSTGANVSEDIVDAMGLGYYKGSSSVDDSNLFNLGFNRYYDVYGKEADYLKMTELIAEFYLTLNEGYGYSSRELLYEFGLWLGKKGIRSIVTVAAEHRVPVFCPGIADSPYGDAALIAASEGFRLSVDAMKDYVEFMRLNEKVKETGVFYVGGGVPKDFIQLFAVTGGLLYKDRVIPGRGNTLKRSATNESYYPHKYAVQVTTDSPQWGGLSGCTFEEAVSWGKESTGGRFAQCYCDATIAIPVIASAISERIKTRRKGTDFSSLFP